MSQVDFYAILDECVARQRQGEALEACLADYPEQAAELNPVLAVSADLLHLPRLEPAPDIVAQGYTAVMGVVEAQEREPWLAGVMSLAGKLWSPLKPQKAGGQRLTLRVATILRVAMALLVVMVMSSALVITVSADSLPGDVLYPVKRSWENTRLALTLSEPSRKELESAFAEQRREEVQAVLELRRPVIVEFEGRLEATGDDVWLVDGLSVEISENTEVSGAIVLGQEVTVRAQVQMDGVLVALIIVGEEGGPAHRTGPTDEAQATDKQQPSRGPQSSQEPTVTRERTDKPTRRPTQEATHRPTQEPTRRPTQEATRQPTVTSEPTATRAPELNDAPTDRITPTPERRPTETPTVKATNITGPGDEPTRDIKPTPAEATATREPENKPTAAHEALPTATKANDSGGGSDRPGN